MSSTTPNRGLRKAAPTDEIVTSATVDMSVNMDILDSHPHAGTDITSGTVAPQRLGTGSPNNANFLRGDGTWAVPAGGGGGASDAASVTFTPTGNVSSSNVQAAIAEVDSEKSAKADNLSDIANPATARTNLGLGTIATHPIADFAQVANNLSDLPTPATARTNLGLGSSATQPSSSFLQPSNNLADLQSASTARGNLGLGSIATHATSEYFTEPWKLRWVADTDWNVFTIASVTGAGTNTYSMTAPSLTSSVNANANNVKVGRLTGTAGSDGNERRFFYVTSLGDIASTEVYSEWRARSTPSGAKPQPGHFHRLQNIGNSTTQTAYVVWLDSTFGQDDFLNVGVWKGTGGSFAQGTGGSASIGRVLESIEKWITVYTSQLASNVATFSIEGGHKIKVGDLVSIQGAATSTYNVNLTVTAVTATTFSAAITAADIGLATETTAHVKNRSQELPICVRSRCVGTQVVAHAWRSGDPEPTWSNPDANIVFTDGASQGPTSGAGKVGILVSHTINTGVLDYGPLDIRTL